jgi:hypothetical protein
MKTRARAALLGAGVLLSSLGLGARPALAEDVANCAVLEISASAGKDPSLDPALAPLEKKLKAPPFASWNVFKLLAHGERALAKLKAETIKLSAAQVTLLFREVEAGKKPRFSLTMSQDDAAGKRVSETKVTIDAGDYLVYVRSLPNGEQHLLALTCKP